ncbi:MAG: tetratricopeptide repeat protein, partial [Gemmataceae bacterium]|nr:tetratricopeptide repeat protein [Gemmataceae bacterium]
GAESAAATDARRRLGEARLRLGKWAAAEADLRAVLAVLDREQPGHWATSDTRSLLGGSLFGRGELAEAEPLLVAGYEGMKARRPTIPPPARPRLPEAADRLVDLYQALGKPDEVKRWRAERATYPFVTPPPREATPKPPGR